MKTRTMRILLVIWGVIALGIGGFSWLNRTSAINTTRMWGRLAPFPKSAQRFTISSEGSMFTRAFRCSFSAPASDIEQWLQQSPGTRETTPATPSPGIRIFKIAPGGGAQWAEVTVDDTEHCVAIYVYWS